MLIILAAFERKRRRAVCFRKICQPYTPLTGVLPIEGEPEGVNYSGGYSGEVPPLPIPNREVKLARADGTAHPWESR